MAVRLAVACLAAAALVYLTTPVQHEFFQLPQRPAPRSEAQAQAWQNVAEIVQVPDLRPDEMTRRGVFTAAAGAAIAAFPQVAFAGDDRPQQYKLSKDYPKDARSMLENMRVAAQLTRGAPDMEQTVVNTRKQMNDFVAFYRRQPQITGKPSFSTLYTATNTLAGHYASYGNKYPVPEKRRVRLETQFKEVDRALARGK